MKGGPGSFFGGPLGAVAPLRGAEAPPASFNVQEERGNVPMSATLRARARDGRWGAGRLDGFGEVGAGRLDGFGERGGGGWMVLRGKGGEVGWFCGGGWFGSGWFFFKKGSC